MQNRLLLLIVIVLTTSCKMTVLDKDFSCNSTTVKGDLDRNEDVKKTFSIQIPSIGKPIYSLTILNLQFIL